MGSTQLLWAVFALFCASFAHSQPVQERRNLRAAYKTAWNEKDTSQHSLQDETDGEPLLVQQMVNASRKARAVWGESELWGQDGELWDPANSLMRDFTDVGYKLGNEPLPDWPVWKSVTEFGAVPNDDQSDVQAFLDAMEDCPPNHAILVPNGRYIIDNRITIPKNNIVLRGESRDGAVLFFPKHMSEIDGTAKGYDYFITFSGGHNRGIENLSLVLRDEQKGTGYWVAPEATKQRGAHWYYTGERLVHFGEWETDSWMRNVYMKNANYAIWITRGAKQLSIIDVVLDNFLLRGADDRYATAGHYGVVLTNQPTRVLIHNMLLTGLYAHDISPSGCKSNVFSRIRGRNIELDHHANGNVGNLFTEIDTGVGGRGYGESYNNKRETYWNIKGERKANYIDTSSECVMVGINTDQPTSIGSTWHHETINPEALVPANMYLAQMAKKPEKWVPPDTELTLPPAASDKVFQILAVDDCGTRKKDSTTNYGHGESILIDYLSHEAFMKFDLNEVDLPESVANAKLRLNVNWGKNPSRFTLFIWEVDDNSWSEHDVTFDTKPGEYPRWNFDYLFSALPLKPHAFIFFLETAPISLVTEVSLADFVEVPGWLDVDITTHVNKVLSSGTDHVMSIKLDGSLLEANRDNNISIRTKEGAKPSHLLVYLDESMVPPPAGPTGLVVTPGYGHITLDWKPNTKSDLVSYNVYRKVGSKGEYEMEAMGLTTTTYTDYVNVKKGKTHTYQVTAVDVAGTESTRSESISASPCKTPACGEDPPDLLGPRDPPGLNPDRWCQHGTSNGEFCCDECGGKCGGSGCESFPGGWDKCCRVALERICSSKQDTACIIPSNVPDNSDGDELEDDTGDELGDDTSDEPDNSDGEELEDETGDGPDNLDGEELEDDTGDNPEDAKNDPGDEPEDEDETRSGYPGPDPAGWCNGGTFLNNFCCGECDGQCGGSACSILTGGSSKCCTSRFENVCSDKNDTACLIPEFDRDTAEFPTDKPSPAPTKKPTRDAFSDQCSGHTSGETCKNDYHCFWDNGVCSDDCPNSWMKVKCVWEKRRNAYRWRSGARPVGGSY
eukprot:scaffold7453_cov177-Amphora_coffeaeformis.AAC.1